jgi:hypothetical protein
MHAACPIRFNFAGAMIRRRLLDAEFGFRLCLKILDPHDGF